MLDVLTRMQALALKCFIPSIQCLPKGLAVGGSARLRIQQDWTDSLKAWVDSLKFIMRAYPRGHHKHLTNTDELFLQYRAAETNVVSHEMFPPLC